MKKEGSKNRLSEEQLDEIAAKLRVNRVQLVGLMKSGLLGAAGREGLPGDEEIDSLLQYGTQWTDEIRSTAGLKMPEPEGWGEAPLSTLSQTRISSGPGLPLPEESWIAHFYLRPNHYFFPQPDALAPVGTCPVRLNKSIFIEGEGARVGVYPDKDGRLALITVHFPENKGTEPLARARNVLAPIVNHLTSITDHPLHIAQQFLIGIPSGDIYISNSIAPREVSLALEDFSSHQPILDAESLYRLALTCNDPTYAYLSYWRAIEAVDNDQSAWIERNDIIPVGFGPTKTPSHKVYGKWANMKFNSIINMMTGTKRNGIAHGGQEGIVISGAHFQDIVEVQQLLPILRFIAKSKIQAFRHNLELAKAGKAKRRPSKTEAPVKATPAGHPQR